jgi:hypothetical protein
LALNLVKRLHAWYEYGARLARRRVQEPVAYVGGCVLMLVKDEPKIDAVGAVEGEKGYGNLEELD